MLRIVAMFFCSLALTAADRSALEMTFVDTEGGQATLMRLPSGASLLVDAGFPGNHGRDSDRIVAAARKMGIRKIDYLLVTHYHSDHVGGVPELMAKFPVGTVIDHGSNTEMTPGVMALEDAYKKAIANGVKHMTVKPGDVLPIKSVRIEVVSARGEVIHRAINGGGKPNPFCLSVERAPEDPTENARSIGILLTYGKFRFVDLGDLTWNKELNLACPNHLLGTVDLFLTTHHGFDASNPAAMVHALSPRVAIMNNGARKGGSPAVLEIVKTSPGLEDLWQLHYSVAGGERLNTAADRIANVEEPCKGYNIEVSAQPDATFTVTNTRNGLKKTYRR